MLSARINNKEAEETVSRRIEGFTLIELIVVILVLGILAAIAAPRFVDLTGQARIAAMNGLRAAVQSATTLANALQTAQGLTANQSVTIEGATVNMTNGYPSVTSPGIDAAVRFDAATFSTTAVAGMTFQMKAKTTCNFAYAAAAFTTQPPVIGTVATGGC